MGLQVPRRQQEHEEEPLTVVLAAGTFDLFHPGHVNLLRHGSLLGAVVAAVNTDRFVEQYKGRPPIMTLAERLKTVAACRYVVRVVVNDGPLTPVLEMIRPRYLIHGSDWEPGRYLQQIGVPARWQKEVEIVTVPYTEGVSTTELIDRCRASGS